MAFESLFAESFNDILSNIETSYEFPMDEREPTLRGEPYTPDDDSKLEREPYNPSSGPDYADKELTEKATAVIEQNGVPASPHFAEGKWSGSEADYETYRMSVETDNMIMVYKLRELILKLDLRGENTEILRGLLSELEAKSQAMPNLENGNEIIKEYLSDVTRIQSEIAEMTQTIKIPSKGI